MQPVTTQYFYVPAGDSRVIPIGIVEVLADGSEITPDLSGLALSVREVVKGALRVASDVTMTSLSPSAYDALPATVNGYLKSVPSWHSINVASEEEPKIPATKITRVFRTRVSGVGIDTMLQLKVVRS
jgi:hypothetical protein